MEGLTKEDYFPGHWRFRIILLAASYARERAIDVFSPTHLILISAFVYPCGLFGYENIFTTLVVPFQSRTNFLRHANARKISENW